ncbi:hypothetical protein D3C71_1346880 [compost metagenome]
MKSTSHIYVIESIIAFERKADELIRLLAKVYELDLSSDSPFGKLLIRKNNLWKGDLPDDWIYHFHGSSCNFLNSRTNQTLDVKITPVGFYGAIDYFYLYQFVRTTPELAYVAEVCAEEKIFYRNIDELIQKQIVCVVKDHLKILDRKLLDSV